MSSVRVVELTSMLNSAPSQEQLLERIQSTLTALSQAGSGAGQTPTTYVLPLSPVGLEALATFLTEHKKVLQGLAGHRRKNWNRRKALRALSKAHRHALVENHSLRTKLIAAESERDFALQQLQSAKRLVGELSNDRV